MTAREWDAAFGYGFEWRNLTLSELNARFAVGARVLWPIGATEQHGPHIATGFDHIAAETVVHAAAARLGPQAVVLPTLAFGSSGHWMCLGGTLTLRHETLLGVLRDVCRSAGDAGARRVTIVNGHMGNIGTALAVLPEFTDEGPAVEFVSYWDLVDRAVLVGLQQDSGVGHAGEFETSIALHIGDLVREDAIPLDGNSTSWNGGSFDKPTIHRAVRAVDDAVDGVVGSASAAQSSLGKAVLESAVTALVAHCRDVNDVPAP